MLWVEIEIYTFTINTKVIENIDVFVKRRKINIVKRMKSHG